MSKIIYIVCEVVDVSTDSFVIRFADSLEWVYPKSPATMGLISGRFKPYEEKENKVENTVTAESLRNSILSLQQERVSLQEKIEQNIAQEKSLTEQLKELGFLLVESKEQPTNVVDEKKAVLYAEDIEEDMTDPRNWKVGDFVQVVLKTDSIYCKVGDVFEVVGFNGDWIKVFKDSTGSENTINPKILKFHSRPVVN